MLHEDKFLTVNQQMALRFNLNHYMQVYFFVANMNYREVVEIL